MEQDHWGFPEDITVGGTEDTVAKTLGSRLWLGNLVQPDFIQYLFRILNQLGPLGRVGLVVAMCVCFSVCFFV